MKLPTLSLFLFALIAPGLFAQPQAANERPPISAAEQELLTLSKDKWVWMAEKNVERLAPLFHEESKFVHMSGTWKKAEELEIIKSGRIWYKDAKVHDAAVELFGETAVVWNRITLTAMLRDNEVVTEFTVTEVYKKEGSAWQMLALTFSSVRDTHAIRH
jgi:hypothetical protein